MPPSLEHKSAFLPRGDALEALCNPHRIRSRLVDIAQDERSTEPTAGDIKLMLTPKVSQISAVTAHPIKPDAPRTGVPRPVSR